MRMASRISGTCSMMASEDAVGGGGSMMDSSSTKRFNSRSNGS